MAKTKTVPPAPQPPQQPLPRQVVPNIVRAPDFKVIYANFAQSGFTAFDISLLFGDTSGNERGHLTVEQRARVVMSPLEAKVLLALLVSTIQQFEKQFGAISIPQGIGIGAQEVQQAKSEGV